MVILLQCRRDRIGGHWPPAISALRLAKAIDLAGRIEEINILMGCSTAWVGL
jgi:hypothetical protein